MIEPFDVSQLFSREDRIGIISKDAGSANLIAHSFTDFHNSLVFCEEPGRTIFNTLGYKISSFSKEVFDFADVLIIGTGGSDFEKKYLQRAHKAGKQTYSVLDHWINYEARFKVGNIKVEPRKLLVFDSEAKNIALAKFPSTPVYHLSNRYEESIRNRVKSRPRKTSKITVLYIHEKITQSFEGKEYWQACFDQFYSHLSAIHEEFVIRLRTHPKDDPAEFGQFVKTYAGVVLSYSDLADDIARSDVVVGIRSAALETARNCGKLVFTTSISPVFVLPGPLSRLPQFKTYYAN